MLAGLVQPVKIAIVMGDLHVSPPQPYNQHLPPYLPKQPQLDLGCKLRPIGGAAVYFGVWEYVLVVC